VQIYTPLLDVIFIMLKRRWPVTETLQRHAPSFPECKNKSDQKKINPNARNLQFVRLKAGARCSAEELMRVRICLHFASNLLRHIILLTIAAVLRTAAPTIGVSFVPLLLGSLVPLLYVGLAEPGPISLGTTSRPPVSRGRRLIQILLLELVEFLSSLETTQAIMRSLLGERLQACWFETELGPFGMSPSAFTMLDLEFVPIFRRCTVWSNHP
jgi:hypothetical protein